MAFDAGGGGVGGTIPPSFFGGGGGGGVGSLPPPQSILSLPGFSVLPTNTFNGASYWSRPVTTTPNYDALLGQAMGPAQDAYNQQAAAYARAMAAMEDQISHQEGFAKEAYGINKSSDQAAYDQYIKQLIGTLVGRGLGNSGARNYYTRIRSEALSRQLALLKNQLNSYVYGLQSQLTNARLSNESALAGLGANLAAQRQQIAWQLPQMYPPTTAPRLHF